MAIGIRHVHFLLIITVFTFSHVHSSDVLADLFDAIEEGNSGNVTTALGGDPAPNLTLTNSAGDTPLLAALKVATPLIGIINALLTAGADVDAVDNNGDTPLLAAINITNSPEIINALLTHNPTIDAKGSTGDTPLLAALKVGSSTDIIEALLTAGADVNIKDSDKNYPLHLAANNIDLCKLLLSALANPNRKNESGETPLHITSSADIAGLLLNEGANPNAKDDYDNTPLHTTSSPDIAAILLAHGAVLLEKNYRGDTALHKAGSASLANCFLTLLTPIPVNAKNDAGQTALHLVRTDDAANALLTHGADASIKDNDGNIPLHTAASAAIAQLLISKNSNFINAKNNSGAVPLHYARSAAIAAKLVAAGVNAVDNDNSTPLHTNQHAAVTAYLISQGASVNAKNKNGDTPLHTSSKASITTALLEASGINVNAQNNFGDTALHITFYSDIATALIAVADVHLEAKNILGRTPLHSQCIAGNFDNMYDSNNGTSVDSYVIINSLISNGANVEAVDNNGNTPLHYFISTYRPPDTPDTDLDKLFAANKNVQNRLGESPLVLYLKRNNISLEQLSWWLALSNGDPVDPAIADYRKLSPLHLLNLDMDPAIWQAIFDKSSDAKALLDALDVKDRTPLHQAVINSQKLLITPPQELYRYDTIIKAIKTAYGNDFSAYVDSKDFNNTSAAEYAAAHNAEILAALQRAIT